MIPQRTTSPTRRRTRRALAATAAALLLVTACGDDDDTADTTTTTTSEAPEETTTSTSGDDDGDDEDGDEASEDELLALLPDVSAIASGYTEAPDDDEDEEDASADAVEDAMEEACPEAAALFEDDGDDDTVEREYDGELEKSITVGLDPTPRNLDEGTIDEAVAAISACETVTLTQDGMDMTIDLAAERDDTYGDRGVLMTMNLSMSHPQLPAPITLEMRGRIFQVGSLGAQVNVTSGFDETTLEPVEGDFDLLEPLAAELETAAAGHEG